MKTVDQAHRDGRPSREPFGQCKRLRSAQQGRREVIRIAITAEAFDAVAATLPLGTVAYGAEIAASGERSIWVERSALDRLELVVRLALLDAEVRGLKELHAEVRAARDAWHAQAEQVTLAPQRRPWWRRLVG